MAGTTPRKKKILCLEGLWDNNLEQRLSVKPLLETISKLNGIKFTHCPANTVSEFLFHLYNFTSSKIVSKYSILYLAFHGHSGRIVLSDQEQMSLEDLADLMGQRFRGWSVLLSCCSVLCMGEKRIKNFIKQTQVGLVIGYRKAVDWGERISLDLIILDHLVNYSYLAWMKKRIETRFPDFVAATGLRFYQGCQKRKRKRNHNTDETGFSTNSGKQTMILNDAFWKNYELDLAEIKISYLNWAIGYASEPPEQHRHLFLRPEQSEYCIVNSRYGRAFAISPFGPGVRGVPRIFKKPIPRGIDEIDLSLMRGLTTNTSLIREALRECRSKRDTQQARQILLTWFWIKLGVHELLFDHIQFDRGSGNSDSQGWIKGRWGFDESEGWKTLTGIRNRVVNVIRFGEHLQADYVKRLNTKLPGFSHGTRSTFLASGVSWNKYGLCAFDCGPVIWSRRGFVHFRQVKKRMNELGWPYKSNARSILKPLYHIALDYRMPPIRMLYEPEEGYSLKSLRQRACQIYELIDNTLEAIDKERSLIKPY